MPSPAVGSPRASDVNYTLHRGLSADKTRFGADAVFWGDGLYDLPTTADQEVADFHRTVARLRGFVTADSPLNLGYLPAALATVTLPDGACVRRPPSTLAAPILGRASSF